LYAIIPLIAEQWHLEGTFMDIAGIGQLDRERITKLIRGTNYTISIDEAAKILNTIKSRAAKLLSHWTQKGWMSRIKRGLYIPIPLESMTSDIQLEEPWIIAEKMYGPCYIAGWSAGEYWGFTEQIFRTITVFTTQKPKNRSPSIKGTNFLLHTVSKKVMFGLKPVWRGQTVVHISDPTRTILDFLDNPKFGGGIRHSIDMFKEYLGSEHKNLELLINYAKLLNNNAVFKRLGFLLEYYAPKELNAITTCKQQLTISKARLDPEQHDGKLVTRWRLWIPKNW
jgi:predicted transcriptional regulator of viral defense system